MPHKKTTTKKNAVKNTTNKGNDEPETKPQRKRHVPTKESVLENIDDLISLVAGEIESRRESEEKVKGIKFLLSVNKQLKAIKTRANRVMNNKNKVKRQPNSNSGFLKPVNVSNEMLKFTGWSASDEHSRVDVTRFVCAYVREKNLQNPDDRRQINPDTKLAKLLKYDVKNAKDPLTYTGMQTYLKHHFV